MHPRGTALMVKCHHVIFGTLFLTNLPVDFFFLFFMYLYICFVCIVICMVGFHSAHICIVYNSAICTKSFNVLIL